MAEIDLTQDRQYSNLGKRENRLTLLKGELPFFTKPKVPWNHLGENKYKVPHSGPIVDETGEPLVPTGDAETIVFCRKAMRAAAGEFCECCGQPLQVIPWLPFTGSLCEECDKQLAQSLGKDHNTPWEAVERPEKRARRSLPWWFDI